MITHELHESNIHNYAEFTGRDRAEDISRYFFRGIACHDELDESLKAAMIWELRSAEKDEETASEIRWVYNEDSESLMEALEEYGRRAGDEDITRSFFELADIRKSDEEAYSSSGFSLSSTEGSDLKISLKEFRGLHTLQRKAPDYIVSLGSIDRDMFNQGIIKIMFEKDVETLDDIIYLPKEWFDEKVSCCVMTDGMVNGFLLVHRYPSGVVRPVLLHSAGAYSNYNLLDMMRFSIHAALDLYPEDTPVLIRRGKENVRRLAEKLFPDKKGEPVIAGERMERAAQ